MAPILRALLLLALPACAAADLPLSPEGPKLHFRTEWRGVADASLASARTSAEAPEVETAPGKVTVRGEVERWPGCSTLEARLGVLPYDLTLHVRTRRREGCADVERKRAYRAVIAGLPPGEYRLRVLHTPPGSLPRRVLSERVRVP